MALEEDFKINSFLVELTLDHMVRVRISLVLEGSAMGMVEDHLGIRLRIKYSVETTETRECPTMLDSTPSLPLDLTMDSLPTEDLCKDPMEMDYLLHPYSAHQDQETDFPAVDQMDSEELDQTETMEMVVETESLLLDQAEDHQVEVMVVAEDSTIKSLLMEAADSKVDHQVEMDFLEDLLEEMASHSPVEEDLEVTGLHLEDQGETEEGEIGLHLEVQTQVLHLEVQV